MVLPLRSAGFSMPESLRTTSCMKPLPPNRQTIFTGTPFCRTTMGASATMPPSGALPAPTCLATSTPPRPDRVAHVESGLREIALALGELDRSEGRQQRRRRKEIGDLLCRPRRRRQAAEPGRRRNSGGAVQHLTARDLAARDLAARQSLDSRTNMHWLLRAQAPRWRDTYSHRPCPIGDPGICHYTRHYLGGDMRAIGPKRAELWRSICPSPIECPIRCPLHPLPALSGLNTAT